jgi:hypothetical protein
MEQRMKRMLKVFTWTISILLGMVVVALGLIYFLPGWDLYIVRSDSMSPVFSARDMIVTRPLSGSLRQGDIVTFQLGTQKVTHRVVSASGESIITKGDANATPRSATDTVFPDSRGLPQQGSSGRLPYRIHQHQERLVPGHRIARCDTGGTAGARNHPGGSEG